MTNNTRDNILEQAKILYTKNGYEGFSIRVLANRSNIGISSIYHFFKDKDQLLKEIFDTTNTRLGIIRAKLPPSATAGEMLLDRIKFQFTHIEDVVFVLKYYLHFRDSFVKLDRGIFPAKAYLHIEEVLEFGIKSGEFCIEEVQIAEESKVIAHAINGFLLEYYPTPPTEREYVEVVHSIHKFLMRSLTNKEASM